MPPPFQVKKVSNEGTSSPFVARIFLGLLTLRDQLYLIDAREEKERVRKRDYFDKQLTPMLEASQASRDAAIEIVNLIDSHIAKIKNGAAVKFQENQYTILDNIDILVLGNPIDDYFSSAEWNDMIGRWEGYVRAVVDKKGSPPQLY